MLDRDALPVGEAGGMRPRVVLLGRRDVQRDGHADVAGVRSRGTDQVARRYGCVSYIVGVNRFAGD